MRKKKRLLVPFAATLFLLLLAGCGSTKANPADTEAVAAAMERFGACQSFTLLQMTDCEETVLADGKKEVYDSTIRLELSLITAPELRMKMETAHILRYDGNEIERGSLSYLVPEGGGYTEYFLEGGQWYKVSTDNADALSGIGTDLVANAFYINEIAFGKAGEEELESGPAIRYEGALGGESLLSMLGATGYLDRISQMSENQQAKIRENLMEDLDDVTVMVWVDEGSGYPVRFSVSLTGILKDLDASIAKSLGQQVKAGQEGITGYEITMTLRDFDAVETITPPPEAASAVPYEGA